MRFKEILSSLGNETPQTVVVPLAHDPDIICSIAQAMAMNIARFILIGEEHKIRAMAERNKADISKARFIPAATEEEACELAADMASDNRAQIMIKGQVQSATFIKAILHKKNDLIQPGHLISGAALFEIPAYHKPLLITDPSVNIAPNLEQKIEIIRNAIAIMRRLGIARPKVACIEAVEKVKTKIPGTVEAQTLAEMSRQGKFGEADVDGPFGFDIAIVRRAAEIKGITSIVAGDADILLLPQLVTANVLYKSFVWCAKGVAASIISGARVPIVLPSRSDSEETKLLSIALAVYLSKQANSAAPDSH